ncbi:MAG: ABC transporter ATP-binding protein [Clostridiales bacterium]|nr:ABC transporter ATP-binding protein [Clostridiales bacterium]
MLTNKSETLLQVEGLKVYFPTKNKVNGEPVVVKAVDDISFTVKEGETFGLVGESGCGKTTAGKAILRVLNPTDGKVIYKGRDIAKMPMREIKTIRRELQLIFQDPYSSLDPRQSVYSILKEAIVCDRKRHSASEIQERVEDLLRHVELDLSMSDRYPHEMSGGQRQRLGIARALACNPKLIVCDEPVSALDVSIQAQIINLFEELQSKLGLTYIFIAHDLAVVRHIASRIGIMYLGNVVELMESRELFNNSQHPYTKALLSAVPTVDYYEEKNRKRILLEGEVPSPLRVPKGCPFNPRCPKATAICREQKPELRETSSNHFTACHNI